MPYNPDRQVCIYVVAEEGSQEVSKIGITELLARRLGSMQSNNWRKLTITAAFPVESWDLAQEVEHAILGKFRSEILRGEWIAISPSRLEDNIVLHLGSIQVESENVIKSGSNIIKLWSGQ